MIDLSQTITELAKKRRAFHSEVDFQHALASMLERNYPKLQVRLGVSWTDPDKRRAKVDLRCLSDTGLDWIELKYKTKRACFSVDCEEFCLREDSALQDNRRALWEDVCRVEDLVTKKTSTTSASRGYAVFLTNEKAYWENPGRGEALDKQFRFREGVDFSQRLVFPKKQTRKHYWPWKRDLDSDGLRLKLKGCYRIKWMEYSTVPGGKFRFFILSYSKAGRAGIPLPPNARASLPCI